MRKFEIPEIYKSPIISKIKDIRREQDPRKKDYSPTELDFGPVKFYIARHFGFCYGVENAVEIAYKALAENPGKRIFLLSEMIHNPAVNDDLRKNGINFIMDTEGKMYADWSELTQDDVVIIPAFGTTLDIEKKLEEIGADKYLYNTTCPFVEKVWKRAGSLGIENHTVIIHGKHTHEETRATFSRAAAGSPSVVVKNIEEANLLAGIILGNIPADKFYELFRDKHSIGFDPGRDLERVGIVNQTTMLATETQEIADLFKDTMIKKYGQENIGRHFADTRDTLCYATNDNQQAVIQLLDTDADLAVVVGGYNSSNTTHLVELLEEKFPVYFISSAQKITPGGRIFHFDIHERAEKLSMDFLPERNTVNIALTCGASCPDSALDEVIEKLLEFFPGAKDPATVVNSLRTHS